MSTDESPCNADARAILRLMRDIALDEERTTKNRIAAARVYLDHWPWLDPSQEGDDENESATKQFTLGGIDPATFVVS